MILSLVRWNTIMFLFADPILTVPDNVFNTPSLYWNSHHFLKPSGRFITIAGTPSLGFLFDFMKVMLWPSMLGGGQRKFEFVNLAAKAAEYERIAQWMQEGKIKAVIEKEFELEDAGKAFAHLKTGRSRGKVVIKVAGEESA